jgi:capsular exopolysaccharide synthesis family protein
LGGLPQQERELLEATRQQSIKSDVYTFLLQKREENALSQEAKVSDSRLVDKAEASMYPVSPKRLFTYVGALGLAFALSIGWVAWKEMLGNTILFRSEIEGATDIPIAAEISDSQSRDYIVIDNLKKPILTEQFMQMRAAVGLYGTNSMKIVMVTSSITGEGKTFVSTNFAMSLAGSSKKVLLIDLDFRNPKLSNLYQATNHSGAAEVLVDKVPIQKVIHSTLTQNMYLMSAGKKRTGATSTLMDGNLESMFKELRSRFDYIIVDTPPLSPVIDAQVVSKYCDVTLFVMRHGVTPKKSLQMIQGNGGLKSIKNVHLVFNGVKSRGLIKTSHAYGYGHAYEYGRSA